VALDLAARGVPVVGLDRDAVLLAALRARAEGLPVETVCADARDFDLGRRFAVVLAPMQTVQLLGGPEGRARFLRCAGAHLEPGGLFALALADALEGFDEETATPPLPDAREQDGIVYFSQPVAVKDEGERVAIHRVREIVDRDGARTTGRDIVRLDRLEPAELEAEAATFGLTAEPRRLVAATDEFVGSVVVMLRG
jgi:SAM-dependent methyltransferase